MENGADQKKKTVPSAGSHRRKPDPAALPIAVAGHYECNLCYRAPCNTQNALWEHQTQCHWRENKIRCPNSNCRLLMPTKAVKDDHVSRHKNIDDYRYIPTLTDQGLFGGLKAFRRKDGQLFLFRSNENARRMQTGAERMCMPFPSVDQFIDAVKQTALGDKRWVPPAEKGNLYIRLLLLGTCSSLGLAPSPEYTFLVYASSVGNYFAEGLSFLKLYIEDEFRRATRGEAGSVKSITNHALVLKALIKAKSRGFSDMIYLDSVHKKNLEEPTSCNIFVAKRNLVSTPQTTGTILAGIKRKTVIDIDRDQGYKVEERTVPVEDLPVGDEVFCNGAAFDLSPVGSITYQRKIY